MLGIRLQDPISSLVGGPVATIRSTATLREAAEALATDLIGLLVVVDSHGVAGVLSERDLVAAIADGSGPTDERVGDRMSDVPLTIDEHRSILDAAAAMAAAEVRHLPVARDGEIVGMISIRDVVGVLVDQSDHDVLAV